MSVWRGEVRALSRGLARECWSGRAQDVGEGRQQSCARGKLADAGGRGPGGGWRAFLLGVIHEEEDARARLSSSRSTTTGRT